MTDVSMPALIGHDPLGFLAALGVLRLTSSEHGWSTTLCWPDGPRNGAVLGAPGGTTLELLVEALAGIVEQTKAAGRLIPGVDGFPPAKSGSGGSDPVKDLDVVERSGLAITSLDRPESFGDWVVSTVAVSARDTDDSRNRLTAAFVRPTGQVTFDRSLAGSLGDANSATLLEGLSGWRRHDGVTGNYFDQRAIRDEFVGQHSTGSMKNAGVPGASWLALMALPMLPVRTADSGRAATVGFRRVKRLSTFRWPVWRRPLSLCAASALLDHPALTRLDQATTPPWQVRQILSALDVDAVFSSTRRPAPQGPDGALGGAEVIAARPQRRR